MAMKASSKFIFTKIGRPRHARTLNRAAKSIRQDPTDLIALGGLYAIYLKSQPKDTATKTNAVALLDRAAKMDFASPRLWQTLAENYNQFDQPKKAAAILLKASLPMHPNRR